MRDHAERGVEHEHHLVAEERGVIAHREHVARQRAEARARVLRDLRSSSTAARTPAVRPRLTRLSRAFDTSSPLCPMRPSTCAEVAMRPALLRRGGEHFGRDLIEIRRHALDARRRCD